MGAVPERHGVAPAAAHADAARRSEPGRPRPGLGADNSSVRIGPLVIQEIHHAPAGGNTDLEFVELFNPTDCRCFARPLAAARRASITTFCSDESIPGQAPSRGRSVRTRTTPPRPTLSAPCTDRRHRFGSPGRGTRAITSALTTEVTLYRAEAPPPAEPSFLSANARRSDQLPRHRRRLAKYHGGRLAESTGPQRTRPAHELVRQHPHAG